MGGETGLQGVGFQITSRVIALNDIGAAPPVFKNTLVEDICFLVTFRARTGGTGDCAKKIYDSSTRSKICTKGTVEGGGVAFSTLIVREAVKECRALVFTGTLHAAVTTVSSAGGVTEYFKIEPRRNFGPGFVRGEMLKYGRNKLTFSFGVNFSESF